MVVGSVDERRPAGNGSRVPPQNLEAEESLLGAMLLTKDAIDVALERIGPGDFYKPSHSKVFEAIVFLYGQGQPIDPTTVAAELHRRGGPEPGEGKRALFRLQAMTPASAHAARYATIVEEQALLRRLAGAGTEISELAYSGPVDVDATLDLAESVIFGVAERRQTGSVSSVGDLLPDFLDQLEARLEHSGTITGVPTGYLDLDHLLLGLQPANLVVVAARPGQGKTSFALGASRHVAVGLGRPILFFSMEMASGEITQRLVAAEAGIDGRKLALAKVTEPDWAVMSQAIGRLASAPFYIDDNPVLTVMDVRTRCRRKKAELGDLALVVVDYLQLMTVPRRSENRQVEVAEISRSLKLLARELETPVMALAQLNRALELRGDKRPVLADLRDSGAVEQDSDVVCFIYRDEAYNPESQDKGTAEIIVAKHRNGPTGKVRLAFREAQARFVNCAFPPTSGR